MSTMKEDMEKKYNEQITNLKEEKKSLMVHYDLQTNCRCSHGVSLVCVVGGGGEGEGSVSLNQDSSVSRNFNVCYKHPFLDVARCL